MTNPPKTNYKDPQYIIAIGVTIISLCALIVSVKQTHIMHEEGELMREYSRASVWPRLEAGISKGHSKEDGSINRFAINLSNSGIGPAIITGVKFTYKDKVARDWGDVFDLMQIPDSIETYVSNSSFNGRIVKAEEVLQILNLDINLPLANAIYPHLDSLDLEIYYESIYGEQWKYDGETTVKIENFEGLPDEEQFQQ